MPILQTRNLKKNFGETQALRGVSFDVEPGEIFGLIGPDGAGKTTTLRLLVGVLDPDGGGVEIDGISVADDADRVRERVGYMPQHFSLYRDLSVEENLNFFADMYFVGKKERAGRIEELYAFSRLKPFAKRPAGKLSGGMQKKLALSCGMIHTPKLLFLDEPTTGVDPVSRRELWDILYRFADRGVGMVVCTPYMDEAERCHRIGLMHEGRFLTVDSPAAVVSGHDENVFELAGADRDAVEKALEEVGEVNDLYPFGDLIHIAASVRMDHSKIIECTLNKNGIAFESVEKVRPSFEDVFMAKIRKLS